MNMLASEAHVQDIWKNAIVGQDQCGKTWVKDLQAGWQMKLQRTTRQMQDRLYNVVAVVRQCERRSTSLLPRNFFTHSAFLP